MPVLVNSPVVLELRMITSWGCSVPAVAVAVTVGSGVAVAVGAAVAVAVGAAVGTSVGSAVGTAVAVAVGTLVTAAVAVGTAVGWTIPPPIYSTSSFGPCPFVFSLEIRVASGSFEGSEFMQFNPIDTVFSPASSFSFR